MSQPNKNVNIDRQDDFHLMQRIANRDHEAFHEFEQKYKKLIYATVYKVVQNHEDVQDIANEVLIKIWKNAHTYCSGKGSLVTWIRTTSRNRAIDHIRSVNRRMQLNEGFKNRIEVEKPEHECGWNPIMRSDTRDLLKKELNKLPVEQREAVELVYFHGLTQRQVAEKLQRPLGTIKARLKRGVTKLRNSFDPVLLNDLA